METILISSGYPPATVIELRRHWDVVDITSQGKALEYLRAVGSPPAVMAIGNAMDDIAADDLNAETMLSEILKLDPTMPVVISTRNTAPRVIVDLVQKGAFDYVVEVADKTDPEQVFGYTQNLVLAINRAVQYRTILRENQRLKQNLLTDALPNYIKTRSSNMLHALQLAQKVAPTPATVLVTGESGTGKELVARLIHQRSPQSSEPFVAINCGAISETLLTSELFGHVKGAFTGADANRPGLIEQAGAGTLLLDEIATVPPSFQVMLLRVLEQRTARAVGGGAEYPVRCRFIAAANRDLEQLVQEGKFREDLWYRLNIFRIHLPPLRQRTGDIAVLAHHFIAGFAQRYKKRINGIDPAVMNLLERYSWPGNVRELQNLMERAVIVCEKPRIGLEDLDERLRNPARAASHGLNWRETMRQCERQLLSTALNRTQGNLSRAAELLGIKRTTLRYRIKQLDLPRG